jgi:hypothetical protein
LESKERNIKEEKNKKKTKKWGKEREKIPRTGTTMPNHTARGVGV